MWFSLPSSLDLFSSFFDCGALWTWLFMSAYKCTSVHVHTCVSQKFTQNVKGCRDGSVQGTWRLGKYLHFYVSFIHAYINNILCLAMLWDFWKQHCAVKRRFRLGYLLHALSCLRNAIPTHANEFPCMGSGTAIPLHFWKMYLFGYSNSTLNIKEDVIRVARLFWTQAKEISKLQQQLLLSEEESVQEGLSTPMINLRGWAPQNLPG